MVIAHVGRTPHRVGNLDNHPLHLRKPKPIISQSWVFVLNTLVCLELAIGSCFFFSWLGNWAAYVGDWCFITGGLSNCLISLCLAVDHRREMAFFQEEAAMNSIEEHRNLAEQEYLEKFREFMEGVFFVLSNLIFTVGCILFYPHLFRKKGAQEIGEEVGAWFYIVGSFGFVLTAYWNSLAMVKAAAVHATPRVGSTEYVRRQLMALELLFSLLGSVCFVTGSFLYRPSYQTKCNSRTAKTGLLAIGWQRSSHDFLGVSPPASNTTSADDFHGLCFNVLDQGTWLYIIGGFIFVLQCCLVGVRLSLPPDAKGEDAKVEEPGRERLRRGGSAPVEARLMDGLAWAEATTRSSRHG
mmetsp:Transcript_15454/g.48624  ORF Transcript_15454/g.48624 Transcript_15454/m.48624 type:complete len:354 (-) Transcript_15454:61-1122(-)|eukprot:CAMPEP_0204586018 /NCGR_PEP_ID=MMETSP0661-20131031/47251_1 /ASSEMBLY_ACC=CAM_ASM_000606 /TAXON_ID=109239 /ORGANISM="Alexandrium margalefi, Strain AMGDE01CS-322" /LENGTH=353 /DNA_ID=CAMNT_0051595623 /DNA_START=40 /DNA_END=1101 /DNA_ORIENTATION=+